MMTLAQAVHKRARHINVYQCKAVGFDAYELLMSRQVLVSPPVF